MAGRMTPLAAAVAIGASIITGGAAATADRHAAIYSIRPDGTGRALVLRLDPPAWSIVRSPGGGKIAFARDNGLFVADANGEHAVRIEGPGGDPKFSPDGRRLAVSTFSSCGLRCTHSALYVVNTDGSGLRLIADGGRHASWAPDSNRLVYEVAFKLHVTGVDGSTDMIVGSGMNPEWAPRGDRIAYLGSARGYAPPCFVDADGRHRACQHGFSAVNGIVWSQDGKRLAFMQATPSRLGAVRSDGKGLVRMPVMQFRARPLAWSSDGTRIAYSKGLTGRQIYVRPVVAGSRERRVTNELDQPVYNDARWRRGRISYVITEP